jgi:hypothetical protein
MVPMPARATAYSLRAALAALLPDYYKSYELEAACRGFGMPEVDAGDPFASKRVYITTRLAGVQLPQMLEIARRVLDEHDNQGLSAMLIGTGLTGVDGELKNLIFAAVGPKPRIVLADAINNVIDIKEGRDRVLVYDRPLSPTGLTWGELVSWWETTQPADPMLPPDKALYKRLRASLANEAEWRVFRAYGKLRYGTDEAAEAPALIPQVYLHYDPFTKRELKTMDGDELVRQRMDFLMLLSDRQRVVIEVDGKQHYSKDDRPSPQLYSEMVAEDRRIRLAGYEVYRFGGWELMQPNGEHLVRHFFDELIT